MPKTLLISLVVGLGVGVVYGLLNVRAPAPPYVALIGLLGIVLGESFVLRARSPETPAAAQAQAAAPLLERPS